jgi:hypothetical protein
MGGLKYSSFEIFDKFWLIIFYGDKNIRIRTRSFSSCVIHLTRFSPWYETFEKEKRTLLIMIWNLDEYNTIQVYNLYIACIHIDALPCQVILVWHVLLTQLWTCYLTNFSFQKSFLII